jgi:hypothetical protein
LKGQADLLLKKNAQWTFVLDTAKENKPSTCIFLHSIPPCNVFLAAMNVLLKNNFCV